MVYCLLIILNIDIMLKNIKHNREMEIPTSDLNFEDQC